MAFFDVIIVLGSICFLAFGEKETEVYANGRVVELQDAHDAGLFSHYCRSDQSPALRQAAPEWRTV